MNETQKIFTESAMERTIEFEKNIAYFYGAKNSERIAKHYLTAIYELENLGLLEAEDRLEMSMLPPLKAAYTEVQNQTQLKFDINKAAYYEFSLILAQAKKASFESIYEIMKNLYQEVFQANTIQIHKSAMLRTFLYQYKISLLNKENKLSDDDLNLMLIIAKASEQELNKLEK